MIFLERKNGDGLGILLCIKKKKNLDTFFVVVAKYNQTYYMDQVCVWDPLESFLSPMSKSTALYIYTVMTMKGIICTQVL